MIRSSLGRALPTLVVAAGLLVGFPPERAQACSGVGPGIYVRGFYPPANATGVPTNAQITVSYMGSSVFGLPASPHPFGQDLELRVAAGGAPVAARITVRQELHRAVVIARPEAPLAANTRFEVVDRWKVPCSGSQCAPGPSQVVAAFETGAGRDTTPPRFAGLVKLEADTYRVCDDGACCGPYTGYPVSLQWMAGSDDQTGPLHYTVYDRGASAAGEQGRPVASFQERTELGGFANCLNDYAPLSSFVGSLGPYLVRAVDWAGNEDTNTVLARVAGSCPSGSAEGTAEGSPDGGPSGPSAAADGAATESSGGAAGCECTLAGSRSSTGSLSLLLALLPALILRCRRRFRLAARSPGAWLTCTIARST